MRLLIGAVVVALLAIASADAAPKHAPAAAAAPLGSPLAPAVKPGNELPTPTDPAETMVIRPDSPGLAPVGPGTIATTPSVNIAQDQIVPPQNVYFLQPVASDNHTVISSAGATVTKVKVTVNAALTTNNYLRLYNAGAGFNGCGSNTNLIYAAVINQTTGLNDDWVFGMAGFTSGISICVTGGYSTSDTTAAIVSSMNVVIGWH